jgi:hypothetical protein
MAAQQVSDGNPDGVCVGQSATDKVGFYGKAPIAQGATVTDGTDATTTQAAVNAIIDRLQALGLIASS